MKTIKQIAEICGVSEQAVRGWCRRNHVAKDERGSFVLNKTVEDAIYKHYGVKGTKDVAKDVSQVAKADEALNMAVIELLQKELGAKNEQILELNKRLAECQKIVNQEQQLRMVAEQKIQVLEKKQEEMVTSGS